MFISTSQELIVPLRSCAVSSPFLNARDIKAFLRIKKSKWQKDRRRLTLSGCISFKCFLRCPFSFFFLLAFQGFWPSRKRSQRKPHKGTNVKQELLHFFLLVLSFFTHGGRADRSWLWNLMSDKVSTACLARQSAVISAFSVNYRSENEGGSFCQLADLIKPPELSSACYAIIKTVLLILSYRQC